MTKYSRKLFSFELLKIFSTTKKLQQHILVFFFGQDENIPLSFKKPGWNLGDLQKFQEINNELQRRSSLVIQPKIKLHLFGFFSLHLKFSAVYTLLWESWATFKNRWALPIFFYNHKGLYSLLFPSSICPPPTFSNILSEVHKKNSWRFSDVLIYTHSDVHVVSFSFPFIILRIN